MHVYLIADYGVGDLAFAEVEAKLREEAGADTFSRVAVSAFDTYEASLAIYQIAQLAKENDIIYHNVAPRKDLLQGRENNDGESLLAGKSKRGALVVGPNSGVSWSLVYPLLTHLSIVDCKTDGSQFRSRDVFPAATGNLLRGKLWGRESEAPLEIPEGLVLATDGYGNIKTSWKNPPVSEGRIKITVGDFSSLAVVGKTSFAVEEGLISFAPGSSDGFYEIFLRGGSAALHLGSPFGGDFVELGR